MREFSYLTFDCYGTLVDWKSGIVSSIAKAAGSLPLSAERLMDAYLTAEKTQEGDYKKYREVLKGTFESLVGELGLDVPDGASLRFAASVPEWPAFRDAAASLGRLGELGYRRYILSNVDNDLLEATIERNGLLVDGVVTAKEVGSYKPSPGHWLRFFEKTGAEKGEVLHVAQSVYHDLVPAKRLGVASAWLNRYGERLPLDVEPTYISDTLSGLVRMLE